MPDMLTLTEHLPVVVLAPGDVLVREGNPSGPVWVLVSGELTVSKGDTEVNTISLPGAVIGEMSVLLGVDHGATVVAATSARLRVADDGAVLLAGDPRVMRLVAEGLARRLNSVSTYLADLKAAVRRRTGTLDGFGRPVHPEQPRSGRRPVPVPPGTRTPTTDRRPRGPVAGPAHPGMIMAWNVCRASVGTSSRAADPAALGAWYRECLGLDADENGVWRPEAGVTVFATFEPETDYFGSRSQQTMINFRVGDLDAMLAQLRAKGADVDGETQDMEGVGRFGWVTDPAGNRIELWQPA